MYNNNNNNYSDDSDNNNSNVQGLTGNVNDRAGEQLLTFNDWNGGGHNVFSDYQQILNRLFEASETRFVLQAGTVYVCPFFILLLLCKKKDFLLLRADRRQCLVKRCAVYRAHWSQTNNFEIKVSVQFAKTW